MTYAYFSVCEIRKLHSRRFCIGQILSFLQSEKDQHLALRTIKGQISFLAVLFQKPRASHCLVKAFVQGVTHIIPPVRYLINLWDLSLVLLALQKLHFDPTRDLPIFILIHKVAFFVAIITTAGRALHLAALTCKEPFQRPGCFWDPGPFYFTWFLPFSLNRTLSPRCLAPKQEISLLSVVWM